MGVKFVVVLRLLPIWLFILLLDHIILMQYTTGLILLKFIYPLMYLILFCPAIPSSSLFLLFYISIYFLINFKFSTKFSVPPGERQLVHYKRVKVVTHTWFEDSIASQRRLPEDAYNLKPVTFEEIEVEERYNLKLTF
jgi:hypothetical protein